MDWFLYDNGVCHERVKQNLDSQKQSFRGYAASLSEKTHAEVWFQ